MKWKQSISVTHRILFKSGMEPESLTVGANMKTLVVTLVLASVGVCQGFVKGGYAEPSSARPVTYINRISADPVQVNQGSSTLPTVSLNMNGAHTVAGEAVLHHVMYNANGVPVVTTINGGALNGGGYNGGVVNGGPLIRGPMNSGALNGAPVHGAHYHGAYTHLLHLQNGPRPMTGGGDMVVPANGADIFSQLLTPNGIPDNRHVHLISGQQLPAHHHFGHHHHFDTRISQMNTESRTRKPDRDPQDRRLLGMPPLATITSQMSGMDSPSTKTV